MATQSSHQFPYGSDTIFAPYTDGTIVGTNIETGSVVMLPPTENSQNPVVRPTERGTMLDYIGNTVCVNANLIEYAQMAGDD